MSVKTGQRFTVAEVTLASRRPRHSYEKPAVPPHYHAGAKEDRELAQAANRVRGVVGSLVVIGLLFVAVGTFRTHQQAAQERAIQTIGGNPVHWTDVQVPLAKGASTLLGQSAVTGRSAERVTILTILDHIPSTNPVAQPGEGMKFWAAEVRIENVGQRDMAPGFFGRSKGRMTSRITVLMAWPGRAG